jgi:hypothetical protein
VWSTADRCTQPAHPMFSTTPLLSTPTGLCRMPFRVGGLSPLLGGLTDVAPMRRYGRGRLLVRGHAQLPRPPALSHQRLHSDGKPPGARRRIGSTVRCPERFPPLARQCAAMHAPAALAARALALHFVDESHSVSRPSMPFTVCAMRGVISPQHRPRLRGRASSSRGELALMRLRSPAWSSAGRCRRRRATPHPRTVCSDDSDASEVRVPSLSRTA